jgi:hypothetical protein
MSQAKLLLITPPFTQLNTPYPATTYIKGYLNTLGIPSFQADLGIEVILRLFSKEGLRQIFAQAKKQQNLSSNALRIIRLEHSYVQIIEEVITFLQHKNPTLAFTICERSFLPEASRFEQIDDLEWSFGTIGVQDKAKYLATLYLEDLGDLISEAVDPYFGFSRYAERLGMSASSYDTLHSKLQEPLTLIDTITLELLDGLIQKECPTLICFSIPFPGNLYSALRCGQFVKRNYPKIKIAMGGGYPNTELRSLSDPRVFEVLDFISLDDGERPLRNIIEYLAGKKSIEQLKRTFCLINQKVQYVNGSTDVDISFHKTGTPDYSDLLLNDYLSVIEVTNPMHRLWSDGRWNKLTMAHGCYWKKCSFCDISLDYIKNYEPISATILCDRMETLIDQTGVSGFHFVDEAAPPSIMKELALELIKRRMNVTWWTNIRFEERFTSELCRLLKASGCIAVSGGLEVASDRLLAKMKKGITVSKVARVSRNFTDAGIMVHAYLMYGFPTQTSQETVDSLEMVRQLFENGIIQSGFWHQFAMTAHAPVGLDPTAFGVSFSGPEHLGFAKNDLSHEDPLGADHSLFGEGLRVSLYNYMNGAGFDLALSKWFDFKIPAPSIPPHFILQEIEKNPEKRPTATSQLIWMGAKPECNVVKKKELEIGQLSLVTKSDEDTLVFDLKIAQWLNHTLIGLMPSAHYQKTTFQDFMNDFKSHQLGDFEQFYKSASMEKLKELGLLVI